MTAIATTSPETKAINYVRDEAGAWEVMVGDLEPADFDVTDEDAIRAWTGDAPGVAYRNLERNTILFLSTEELADDGDQG